MKPLLYVCSLMLVACTHSPKDMPDDPPVRIIDLTGALQTELKLSDIVDTLIYYPLVAQHHPLAPQDKPAPKAWRMRHPRLAGDFVLLLYSQCHVYDRANCTFIGSWGTLRMTVSDHYTSVLRSKSCQITSTDQKVLLQAGQAVKTKWNQFWELRNLHNGERTDSIPLPGNRIDNEYALFDDSLIITYRIGERGRENDLRLINRKGEVVKTFHSQQKPIVFYSMTSTGPAFMYRQDSIYRIYHNLNDTVYGITQQQHLIPLYVFHSGEKNIPYEIRSKIWGLGDESTQKQNETYRKLEQKYHCVDNVTETDRYLFAGFTHADRYTYVLYDKQSGNTRLIPACPLPENLWQGNPTLLSNEHVPELHALPNDIDGGLTFWPRSVTEDGDLLAVYDPVDLREKVLATDVSTLRNPAAYQALKEMVTSLPDDNYYIVVQAKVKK